MQDLLESSKTATIQEVHLQPRLAQRRNAAQVSAIEHVCFFQLMQMQVKANLSI